MNIKCEKVFFDGEKIILKEEEIKGLSDDEIIIKSEWSQISVGTETAFIRKAAKDRKSLTLGYSLVGIVEKKGKDVKNVKEGDRILALASHSSYIKVKATPSIIVKVPNGVPSDIAPLGILGSVAFHIVERASIKLGESVAVLGQGIVGSFCMQISKLCGAKPVIAIDVDEERLKIAKEYGADYCLNSEKDNLEETIFKITNGDMLNVVIEATARSSPINIAKKILGIWGRLVLTSCTYDPIYFIPEDDIVNKERTIIGAHQPKCPVEKIPYYPFYQVKNRIMTLEYLRDGILKIDKLITHRIKKEKIPEMYSILLKEEKRPTGVLIDWR